MAYGSIYLVTNTVSGKRYVGQTTMPVATRWAAHVARGRCPLLGKAIAKYGPHAFSVRAIAWCGSQVALDEAERLAIATFGTMAPAGYNLTLGGRSGSYCTNETKAKVGEASRARWADPVIRERMMAAQRVVVGRPEYRERVGRDIRAAWRTPEYRGKVLSSRATADNRRRVPVVAVAADGVRSLFPAVHIAASVLGLHHGAISMCINGKRRFHGGYRFERAAKE